MTTDDKDPRNVIFPSFELYGPPCETPSCKGVLIDSVDIKTQDYFQSCSVCKGKFNRKPAVDKLNEAIETIERVLKGTYR